MQSREVAGLEPSGERPPESLSTLLGGRRAALDASLPPVAFVVGWLLTERSIGWGAALAIGVSLIITGYRLAHGARPRAVLIGVLGVLVAAILALYTGRAEDFFLPRLLSNAASALAWMVSIVLRWPLLGVVVGTILRQGRSWRRDLDLVRAYSLASWVWVVQYLIRTTVFGALYALGWTAALGVAQVALTWPLVAACVATSAVVLRRAMPSDHPGLRRPRAPVG